MIETIRQGLKADGIHVPISKLCQWFAVPRRTVYSAAAAPVMLGLPAVAMSGPAFGFARGALLDFDRTRCSGSSSSRVGR